MSNIEGWKEGGEKKSEIAGETFPRKLSPGSVAVETNLFQVNQGPDLIEPVIMLVNSREEVREGKKQTSLCE